VSYLPAPMFYKQRTSSTTKVSDAALAADSVLTLDLPEGLWLVGTYARFSLDFACGAQIQLLGAGAAGTPDWLRYGNYAELAPGASLGSSEKQYWFTTIGDNANGIANFPGAGGAATGQLAVSFGVPGEPVLVGAAGGTVSLAWAQDVSNAASLTIQSGSWLSALRIG
jgi:hypothetical protein